VLIMIGRSGSKFSIIWSHLYYMGKYMYLIVLNLSMTRFIFWWMVNSLYQYFWTLRNIWSMRQIMLHGVPCSKLLNICQVSFHLKKVHTLR